jgi:hypothetical protein
MASMQTDTFLPPMSSSDTLVLSFTYRAWTGIVVTTHMNIYIFYMTNKKLKHLSPPVDELFTLVTPALLFSLTLIDGVYINILWWTWKTIKVCIANDRRKESFMVWLRIKVSRVTLVQVFVRELIVYDLWGGWLGDYLRVFNMRSLKTKLILMWKGSTKILFSFTFSPIT